MLDLFKKGESFYYANRNTKQVEKCATRELIPQHPIAYIAKKMEITGEVFKCYHNFGCFRSEKEAFNYFGNRNGFSHLFLKGYFIFLISYYIRKTNFELKGE